MTLNPFIQHPTFVFRPAPRITHSPARDRVGILAYVARRRPAVWQRSTKTAVPAGHHAANVSPAASQSYQGVPVMLIDVVGVAALERFETKEKLG